MANEPNRKQPDIKPPTPNVQPRPVPVEIPPDKDAPEREAPIRAADPGDRDIWWC
jgi:hypothetical protein